MSQIVAKENSIWLTNKDIYGQKLLDYVVTFFGNRKMAYVTP